MVAALHLARRDGRELNYVGKVGTGWSMKQSAELRDRLSLIEIDAPALIAPRVTKTTWVKPRIEVKLNYRATTAAGMLRHSVWKDLGLPACEMLPQRINRVFGGASPPSIS